MSLVAFVVHEGRATAVDTAETLRRDLEAESVGTRIARGPDDVREDRPDLVVSVGGDGTFLRAARVAAEADCPVLGVKVGRPRWRLVGSWALGGGGGVSVLRPRRDRARSRWFGPRSTVALRSRSGSR